jgi:hypothetical protein
VAVEHLMIVVPQVVARREDECDRSASIERSPVDNMSLLVFTESKRSMNVVSV